MFWYTLLLTIFAMLCIILVLLILIQKGKSSMGLGSLGGGSQLLFGGSGGQDLFQKTTWALGTIFMVASLVLAMVKRPSSSQLLGTLAQKQAAQVPALPSAPAPTK
jgi:preprotein translocase subunit SecG